MSTTAAHEHKCSCGGRCTQCRRKQSRPQWGSETDPARAPSSSPPPSSFRFSGISVSAPVTLAGNSLVSPAVRGGRRHGSLDGDPLSSPQPVPELFPRGSTLPYREATELQECIRIMGDPEYCRRTVLGTCTAGPARNVTVQPVFFRDSAADPAPTGASWSRRMSEARSIWGKLGVGFTESSAVTLTDATNKTAGSDLAEFARIIGLRSGAGNEVFVVDNDIAWLGGAGTSPPTGGAGAKAVLSDRGTSNTLLAHELGHVMGLGHPPGDADANTVMAPTNSHSTDNPRRNTLDNLRRITFPQATGITCIDPDT